MSQSKPTPSDDIMTPKELNDRCASIINHVIVADSKSDDPLAVDNEGTERIKQLIRDCIASVTPEPMTYSIKTADTSYKRGWRTGAGRVNAEYQRTIEQRTKELLG